MGSGKIAVVLIVVGLILAVYSVVSPSGELGKVQIKFYVTLAGSLIICGIGIVLLFANLPDKQRSVLVFATAVTGGIAALYSAFYVGQALKVNTERDRISSSVEMVNRLDGPQLTSVRRFINTTVLTKKMTELEVYDAIEADDKLWNSVRMVLNQAESLSLCIQRGFADEEFLYKELAHMVPFYFNNLYPFVVTIRKKYNYPQMYIEYEKLSKSWEAKRLLSTGGETPELK